MNDGTEMKDENMKFLIFIPLTSHPHHLARDDLQLHVKNLKSLK